MPIIGGFGCLDKAGVSNQSERSISMDLESKTLARKLGKLGRSRTRVSQEVKDEELEGIESFINSAQDDTMQVVMEINKGEPSLQTRDLSLVSHAIMPLRGAFSAIRCVFMA